MKIGSDTLRTLGYADKKIRLVLNRSNAKTRIGIEDVQKAMQPLYTTGDPELRAGLGFAVMQNFTDKLAVHSKPGKGTRVVLYKQLGRRE